MTSYSINFIDLFDWEKESDVHYYQLLHGPIDVEELKEQRAAEIKIVHETKSQEEYDNNQVDEGAL